MKKRTLLGILLSVLCIFLLLGLGIYLMVDMKKMDTPLSENSELETLVDEVNEDGEVLSSDEAVPASENHVTSDTTSRNADGENSDEIQEIDGGNFDDFQEIDQQTAAALAAANSHSSPLPEHHIIFVGDSRTVGMGEAESEIGDGCCYIGEVGEGYYWFADNGLARMEEAMEQYPDSPVVLNLGVNDPDALKQYLELYQTFADRYPDHEIYFMSVNPVTEECKSRTNMEIAEFNSQLKAAFPDQYLDCNTYMKVREFESADGVHYSDDTYCMIHDYVVNQIFK